MSDYFIYYTESSIICLIIFGIMLFHDLGNVDRQERQIRYDQALVSFMLYIFSDALWAAVIAGVLPRNKFTVAVTNFSNFILMAYITYSWLRYVFSVSPDENTFSVRRKQINIPIIPLVASVVILLILYVVAPETLFTKDLMPTMFFCLFMVTVPIIYIIIVMVYSLRRALREKNPVAKRQHLYLGLFPLMVVIGGLTQTVLLPDVPIFCFSCTILMLIFYIRSMEDQISLDPLTGLNNRGQMHRYVSQDSNLFREGLKTFIAMIDVNDFKHINDEYGHVEGDHALIIIADSLRQAAGMFGSPIFIARYGGDEFIIIMHCDDKAGPEKLARIIRRQIQRNSLKETLPYSISIAYGWSELKRGSGSFEECLERADHELYLDKGYQKSIRS